MGGLWVRVALIRVWLFLKRVLYVMGFSTDHGCILEYFGVFQTIWRMFGEYVVDILALHFEDIWGIFK